MIFRKKAVLFVSDGASDLATHKQHLESSGFSVVTASTGHDGMALFKSRGVDAVVFEDSSEETGGQFTAAIKQLKPRTPVIIVAESDAVGERVRELVDAMVLKAQLPELLPAKLQSLIKIRSHSHRELIHQPYVVFSDASRHYLDCSDQVCQLLGYARMELTSMTIDDVSYRQQRVHELFEQYVSNGKLEGQYILRHKNGKPIFIHYRSEIFSDGCMAAVWEMVEDWKQLYQTAMLEFDPEKLTDAVEIARHAVEERIRTLAHGAASDAVERQQLEDALSGLRVLTRELPR